MGLGTKIKEAFHGDHNDAKYNTSKQSKMPGTFDNGEVPQRHSDGKPYTAPHGTMVGQEITPNSAISYSDKYNDKYNDRYNDRYNDKHAQEINDEWEATGDNHDSFKPGHRSRDSGVGMTDPISNTANSPRESATQGGSTTSATSGYWGDMPQRQASTNTRDLPDRSASRKRDSNLDNRYADQAVGGGVYNPTASTGVPERTSTRGGRHSDNAFSPTGRADDFQDMDDGYRSDRMNTSGRNDHTGTGLMAAGAAGAGAGYTAHELSHRDKGHSTAGYDQRRASGEPAPGMPRSSMLDIDEPAQPGYGSSTMQPGRENFSSTGCGYNSSPIGNNNSSSSFNKMTSPTTTSSGPGSSSRHFGPGHEGSKVMHTCEHCGRDNDISRYFSKDVVYRLGS